MNRKNKKINKGWCVNEENMREERAVGGDGGDQPASLLATSEVFLCGRS